MVVVLGIFYFGQDERLRDEAAVCRAVDETCGWVLQEGWRNVVIEINNECNVPRYEHEILQPHRVHELIARAQRVTHGGDRLLVGTSYGGGRIPDDTVCAASDFILLHGNGVTEPARIAAMVDQTRALPAWAGQPIAFTEDDHFALRPPRQQLHGSAVAAGRLGVLRPWLRRRRRPGPRQLRRRLPERAGELVRQHAAQARLLRPAAAGNRSLIGVGGAGLLGGDSAS